MSKKLEKLVGICLIVDGLGSLWYFREQPKKYHIPRLVRTGIGLWLLLGE